LLEQKKAKKRRAWRRNVQTSIFWYARNTSKKGKNK